MLKFLFCAVAFIFLSATAHFSHAQTNLADTIINDLYVFSGEYQLSGNVFFGREAVLEFSLGTEISVSDSTCLTVLGKVIYASDYDSVSIRRLTPDLTSVKLQFIGQVEDSLELRNWSIADLLLQALEIYPDSLAVLNFSGYSNLKLDNFKINRSGVIQVSDNAITKTFGAMMMDNISRISISNSFFSGCQSSNTGGALTICNSDSIFLHSSRFYENVAIDSAEGGGRVLYWGQGSSCSVDISNKYLNVRKCVFAFDKESITATYLSAQNTFIDNSIFYKSSYISLLTQASNTNRTTITSSSFLHCANAISGGANLLMQNCVVSNDTIPILNGLGRSVEFFVNIPPRYVSSNVYYPRNANCVRCGTGFIPYDPSDDVLNEAISFQLDGYEFKGVFPLQNGLLFNQSANLCDPHEMDVFGEQRCVFSAPDIGAVELQQTVSVEEVLADEFNLYPNPASEHLYIQSATPWEASEFFLVNVTGRQIPLRAAAINENTNALIIPKSLASGIYLVFVLDAKGVRKVGKVVIALSW